MIRYERIRKAINKMNDEQEKEALTRYYLLRENNKAIQRKNKRKTIGRKQRKTATKRSKLQPCEKYAVTRTEIPKTCTLAKRSKTQKRLLHRKQLRGDQPGYGDEIPQIHTDQNPQEDLK